MGRGPIRLAQEADLPALREIEQAAGQAFRPIGMASVADDELPTLESLRSYQRDGRAWVYADPDVVAYLIGELVDGAAHVEQVSVHPSVARRGIGRALIEELAGWGREHGARSMTLTTFVEVAWNGPYYERCGFHYLGPGELSPGLAAIREDEVARGLDRWPRAAMRRHL
jgi:GNAT superfamily N-acetyltransferase